MDHVGFCKNGASSRYPGDIGCLQGNLAELFDRKTKPGCLLIKKRSRAGGAQRIHRKILYPKRDILFARMLKYDELRILSADIYDASR